MALSYRRTLPIVTYATALAALGTLYFSPAVDVSAKWISLLGVVISALIPVHRLTGTAMPRACNLATLGFLLYAAASVALTDAMSLIDAGYLFLLFVLVNKLINRRFLRDYFQIVLVSLLIVVAATTLNADMTYAACFALFILFGTWTMVVLHFCSETQIQLKLTELPTSARRKNQPPSIATLLGILDQRRLPAKPLFIGTTAVALAMLSVAIVVFVLTPRVGFGFFWGKHRSELAMAGFQPQVQLGHHGLIRDNYQVVMRVFFAEPKPPPTPLYFRGAVFDTYARGQWEHSSTVYGIEEIPQTIGVDLYWMNPGIDISTAPDDQQVKTQLFRQDIYLEPLDSNILFGADRPIALSTLAPAWARRHILNPRRGPNGEIHSRHTQTSGVRYMIYSQIAPVSPARLATATAIPRDQIERFLQIPITLSQHLSPLAEQITRNYKNDYDKAQAIAHYLRTNFKYTTQLPDIGQRDPVQAFIFETKKGHCEYFASAMTLLARSAGIAARTVNGFVGGAWNPYGQYLAVRQNDAHAWSEILLGGIGWIRIDATPRSDLAASQQQGFFAGMQQWIDTLRLRWFRYVIEYDVTKQIAIARAAHQAWKQSKYAGLSKTAPKWTMDRRTLGMLTVAAGLLLAIYFLRHRLFSRWALFQNRSEKKAPVTLLYERMTRALSEFQLDRQPGQTPYEFAQTINLSHPTVGPLVDDITKHYYQVRYGGRSLTPALRRKITKTIKRIRKS